jgi:hypothetical protein
MNLWKNYAIDISRYFGVLHFVQGTDSNLVTSNVAKISLRIVLQVIGNRDPNGSFSSSLIVIEDNSRNCSAYFYTCTVPDEKNST